MEAPPSKPKRVDARAALERARANAGEGKAENIIIPAACIRHMAPWLVLCRDGA